MPSPILDINWVDINWVGINWVDINRVGINRVGINRPVSIRDGSREQSIDKKKLNASLVRPFGPPSLRFTIRIHRFSDILFIKEGGMISNDAFDLVEVMLEILLLG